MGELLKNMTRSDTDPQKPRIADFIVALKDFKSIKDIIFPKKGNVA